MLGRFIRYLASLLYLWYHGNDEHLFRGTSAGFPGEDHPSPGMTAMIELSGASCHQLEADMVLGPASSHDAADSCAVADAKRA
ncbi:MAG TPA: hypothetical protein VNH11_01525 [Pirellulales bacterium]|nr:hypothetical protein [Pirellulales bacterium]